jgi:hypothetical protein
MERTITPKSFTLRILPADNQLFGPTKNVFELACCAHCGSDLLILYRCGRGFCAVCSNCHNHWVMSFKPNPGQLEKIS